MILISQYVLLSDTHMPARAKALPNFFTDWAKNSDAILHAGDFTNISVIEELECYGQVYGVHGNNDSWDVMHKFPSARIVDLDGFRIGMTHGHFGRARTTPERAREHFSKDDVDLIVFGHSHTPFDETIGGVRCLNPGSLCDPRRQPTASFMSFTVQPGPEGWDIQVTFHPVSIK